MLDFNLHHLKCILVQDGHCDNDYNCRPFFHGLLWPIYAKIHNIRCQLLKFHIISMNDLLTYVS